MYLNGFEPGNGGPSAEQIADATLFTDNLSDGDLLDALGLPLAANTGMDTLFAGFALAVIDHAATPIAGDFSGLF